MEEATLERSTIVLRPASAGDLPALHAIYAGHVRNGLASFEEVPPDLAEFERRWRSVNELGLPYLVACERERLLGYAYAGPYRPRSAYRFTVEDSVYIARECGGQGFGSALLAALIERCEAGPWRQMVAVIGDSDNRASIQLHRKFGFRHVGTLERVGFKFGRWVDSVLMQRALAGRD